jgi:hypothetical protein
MWVLNAPPKTGGGKFLVSNYSFPFPLPDNTLSNMFDIDLPDEPTFFLDLNQPPPEEDDSFSLSLPDEDDEEEFISFSTNFNQSPPQEFHEPSSFRFLPTFFLLILIIHVVHEGSSHCLFLIYFNSNHIEDDDEDIDFTGFF